MAKKKFYSVKAGRISGIYETWEECKKQVDGYPGALYKSFATKQEAEEYLSGGAAVKTAPQPKTGGPGVHYDIYVDGSYYNKRYSWGFAVYNGTEVIHTEGGLGEDAEAAVIHNVAGELEAAVKAVTWAIAQKADTITLHHDYIGISEWAAGRWRTNNKFTQRYAAFMAAHVSWVNFVKVAGHSGVEGNELADKLAGEALKKSFAG